MKCYVLHVILKMLINWKMMDIYVCWEPSVSQGNAVSKWLRMYIKHTVYHILTILNVNVYTGLFIDPAFG
jgi:hypothetical protein